MSFTHVNKNNDPCMVNVSEKNVTTRKATAKGEVYLPPEILSHFSGGEIHSKKGPVFQTAIIAATMAVKKTSEIIPFCHPIAIEGCDVTININDERKVEILCTVSCSGKTGVEMEAIMGVQTAAITIYDMCKALSQKMVIDQVRLLEKSGGKSDIKNL